MMQKNVPTIFHLFIPKYLFTECMSGYYRDGDVCEECGYGSFSAPASGKEVTECTECTGGRTTTGTTSTSSNDCGKSGVTVYSQRSLSAQIVPVIGSTVERSQLQLLSVVRFHKMMRFKKKTFCVFHI